MHPMLTIILLYKKHYHRHAAHHQHSEWYKFTHSTWHDWLLWAVLLALFVAFIASLLKGGNPRRAAYKRHHNTKKD